MNLWTWILEQPQEILDEVEACVLCHADEVWDYGLCVTCAEEMNADKEATAWWDLDGSEGVTE